VERFIKAATMVAMGVFLYSRLLNGSILFYINQRFVTLTLLASVGFLLVGFSIYRQRSGSPREIESNDGHQHDHLAAGYHHHDHGRLAWWGLLIVMVPLVFGWLVPPRPLGATAVGNREIGVGSLSSPAGSQSAAGQAIPALEKNIVDWLFEIQASGPAALVGQEALVTGFVFRDERFAEDSFMIGRFIVSCCVADAAPVGLIVRWPEAASLADDQWIEARGRFTSGTFDGHSMPVLILEDVSLIDPPAQPYLYG
jgi:putative membrane protein